MSVKDGRQKSTPSRASRAAKLNSPVSFKKQPWTAFNERNASPSTDGKRASLRSVQSVLARNSVGSSKSSLRSSIGSCHDACKFGGHGNLADSDATAKFGGKTSAKKAGAAKVSKPAVSKIAVVKSPVGLRNYNAPVNKSVTRENPSSVNGRAQNSVNRRTQNGVQASVFGSRVQISDNSRAKNSVNGRVQKPVNSRAHNSVNNSRVQNSVNNSRAHNSVNSRESYKPYRASMSTPEGKFKVTRSLFRSPSKICDNKVVPDSIRWQSPVARSLLAAFESPSGDLLLSQAFEDYSCQILDDKSEEEFFRQYYPENTSNSVINSSGVSEISFEAFSGDQFSEISTPRSLEVNNNTAGDVKMRLRRGNRSVRESADSNPGHESVHLRHQDMQERKDYLIDHVMEEAVTKLSHCEESKVKMLVGAFETVISLRDSHDAAAADHTRPLQTCN